MQILQIPASYEVWFTGLKHHLERHPGSKAELARHLERVMSIKFSTAQVKVSRLLAREFTPSAETFLDIAAWLQRQTESLGNPPAFNPLAPLRRETPAALPSWREGGDQNDRFSTRVAEDPPV